MEKTTPPQDINLWTKKDFKSLPQRSGLQSVYDSIIILPNGKKHESDYGCMDIVGCIQQKPVEIITGYSDHLQFSCFDDLLNMDCLYKSKLVRLFKHGYQFHVGHNYSSVYITLVRIDK